MPQTDQPTPSHTSRSPRASGPSAVVANEALLSVAERELNAALKLHDRPMAGMYAQPSREGDAALDLAVRALCDEAHRVGLRAEEMLIVLKQAWTHLSATRAAHLGDRDGDVLRHVVTSSIEVYFGKRPGSPNDQS